MDKDECAKTNTRIFLAGLLMLAKWNSPNVHPLVTAHVGIEGRISLSHKRYVLTCTTT